MTILPRATACYRCAFPVEPEDSQSCAEAGILGPAAGVLGTLQALEAIKLLSSVQPPLLDAFLTVDLVVAEFTQVHVQRAPTVRTVREIVRRAEHDSQGLRELRRDIAAVRQRDPAAARVSTAEILPSGPVCTRCSCTAWRTRS